MIFVFWLLIFRRWEAENVDSCIIVLAHDCSVYDVRFLAYEIKEQKRGILSQKEQIFIPSYIKMLHSTRIKDRIIKYDYLKVTKMIADIC